MLQLLVTTANFIQTAVCFVFYGSYKTGFFLINTINLLLEQLGSIAFTLSSVGSVLYDSLTVFCQDNLQFLQGALHFVTSSLDATTRSVMTGFSKGYSAIQAVLSVIVSVYNAVAFVVTMSVKGLIYLGTFIHKMIILFGSGVWFLVSFLPLMLYYTYIIFVQFVTSLYHECCDITYQSLVYTRAVVKNTVLFVTDVPWESLAGLIVAACLAYTFMLFYLNIKAYCIRKFRYLQRYYRRIPGLAARNTRVTPARRRPVRNVREQAVAQTPVRRQQKDSPPGLSETYCVICQEHPKCVLLLPCKHVCMCLGCARELRYYNGLCPICRTDIENTMKIYI